MYFFFIFDKKENLEKLFLFVSSYCEDLFFIIIVTFQKFNINFCTFNLED